MRALTWARALRLFNVPAALLLLIVACRAAPNDAGARAAPPDGGAAGAPPKTDARSSNTARVRALREAEHRRASSDIRAEDLAHHDPAVRRAASRALARIAGPSAIAPLLRTLVDEDTEVVAWCAHGLGSVCANDPDRTTAIVRALIVRAVSLASTAETVTALDPTFAIARALGHCASDEAEKTLQAWITGPRPRAAAAALALGDIAARRKNLTQETQATLLTVAAGDGTHQPLREALHAFGHLDNLSRPTSERLLTVAESRLFAAGGAGVYAIRALAHADAGAVAPLRRALLAADRFTEGERAEAARALGGMGAGGQRALGEVLAALADSPDAHRGISERGYGLLLVVLEQLRSAEGPPARALFDLARLPVPSASGPLRRRAVEMRCRAAGLLVNGAHDEPLLTGCDADPDGESGQLAALTVLARRPLRGDRLTRYRVLATSEHLAVRERALDTLLLHPEAWQPALLLGALAAPEPTLVARAAGLLSAHPERVGRESAGALAEAVARALETTTDVTADSALLEAAGALQAVAALPSIQRDCVSPNASLRAHAARALALLQASSGGCDDAPPAEPASELGHLLEHAATLAIETDMARLTLTLDPKLAPVAATRVADLARAGFYDGMLVHRVVPGFVVQFGDRDAAGSETRASQALGSETSPVPFEPLDVGMALNGSDTSAAALFVTLARTPHLDGAYTLVGHASGEWGAVAQGDTILRVKVLP